MTAYRSRFARLLADRGGNFAATTAILLPVLLGVAGVAIDYLRMTQEHTRVQNAADSAALAAATALAEKAFTEEQARLLALSFLRGQMAGSGSTGDDAAKNDDPNAPFSAAPTILINETPIAGNGKKFTVSVEAHYKVALTGFTRVLGVNDPEIVAYSKTASQTATMNALSMYLVLDKSGSMAWITDTKDGTTSSCPNYTASNWSKYPNLKASSPCYVSKITALKTAVTTLAAQLVTADPKSEYSRLGAVSYNMSAQTPSPLDWGTTKATTYVNALVAEGGTASTDAMQKAYSSLTDAKETKAHTDKTGLTPQKFIVFMTDGDNNNTYDDTQTLAICDKARADKITIYTVAFMAPSRGQNLLKTCAGTTANYFAADSMAQLVDAFKTIGKKAADRTTRLTN